MHSTLDPTEALGASLRSNAAIDAAIRDIVAEVAAKSSQITGARPARDGAKETLAGWLKRATEVRGRGPLYP